MPNSRCRPVFFHPGRHVAQGTGCQQAVDDQNGDDGAFRQPALARTAPVHRRRQADPVHIGQHQVEAADLVGDLLDAALLEGGHRQGSGTPQDLYLGGREVLESFYLDLAGDRYLRLGQGRREPKLWGESCRLRPFQSSPLPYTRNSHGRGN